MQKYYIRKTLLHCHLEFSMETNTGGLSWGIASLIDVSLQFSSPFYWTYGLELHYYFRYY